MLDGELYAQILVFQKLVYQSLFTDCFMKISLRHRNKYGSLNDLKINDKVKKKKKKKENGTAFVLMVEERSS